MRTTALFEYTSPPHISLWQNDAKVLVPCPAGFCNKSVAQKKVIATEAKQSNVKHRDPLRRIGWLRRFTPRNDSDKQKIAQIISWIRQEGFP